MLKKQGSFPGAYICLRALYLDYTFIWGGLVSRWQLTAVQVELKPLTAIPAFRCDDERGLLLWARQATEEAREMGP